MMEDCLASRRFFLYNTICRIDVLEAQGDVEDILDGAQQIAEDVQELLNIYDSSSQLSQLNENYQVGIPYPVSPQLFEFLKKMWEIAELSDGTFDPTVGPIVRLWNFTAEQPKVPLLENLTEALQHTGWQAVQFDNERYTVTLNKANMVIDGGGAGKGYAVELVANHLKSRGVCSASINFGGNLFVIGKLCQRNKEPRDWQVGIQEPWQQRGNSIGKLAFSNKGVATSGGYERFFTEEGKVFHHLLDPRTGFPVESEFLSLTIVSSSAFYTDLLSTPFFILGEVGGKALLDKLNKKLWVGFIAVKNDHSIITSENLRSSFFERCSCNLKMDSSPSF